MNRISGSETFARATLSAAVCRTAIAGFLAVVLIGCGKPPAAQAPPPPAVTVAHPLQRDVIEWDTYTGHLEAPQSANVAARVSGLILEMPFVEGSIVKRGDVLALIDPAPYKADLDAKIAEEKKAKAALDIDLLTFNRYVGLRTSNAVSQQDVDNAKGTADQADAALAAARADVETSRLNLSWCKVLSPIDGRVSDKLITVGNLVNGGAGQATLLTTVQSVTPMYCYVDVDEHAVLKYQKIGNDRKIMGKGNGEVPCYVQLGNETDFPHEGHIDFVDNHVDPTTGTQRVRGTLENKSGLLTPGFFARLCVPGSGKYSALLVPDNAVGTDQSERNVLVLGKDNVVAARIVQLGPLFGSLRSIVSGIGPNDRIIINGNMHARPGAPVSPTNGEIKFDATALAGPGGSPAHTVPTTGANVTAAADSPATQPAASSSSTETRS